MPIDQKAIAVIEQRLKDFWETYEGKVLKEALEEQTKKITQLENENKELKNDLEIVDKHT